MEYSELIERIETVADSDKRYKLDAYLFVINALEYTQRKKGKRGHVSGQELLLGIRDYAKELFGPTARMVCEHWGIRRTEEFGEIVFNLIDAGILGKSDRDSKKDFQNVYDFAEVFEKEYEWKIERPIQGPGGK